MRIESESKLVSQCLQYLKLKGIDCWRSNNNPVYDTKKKIFRKHVGILGLPDILGIMPHSGKLICIECKIGSNKQSEHQKDFEIMCKQNGAIYLLVYNIEQLVKKFLEVENG